MAIDELLEDKKAFIEQVKKLRGANLGQREGVVPILATGPKKPPGWFNWTPYRNGDKAPLTDAEIETIFSSPEVGRAAIMLGKKSFVIDTEGEGLAVQHILEQRMSSGLREKIQTTRTTITPHGRHKYLLLSPEVFPDGIEEMLCWALDGEEGKRKKGEHAKGSGELRVLSQEKYAIEAGAGYDLMNPEFESAAELNEEESNEVVALYKSFKKAHDVIRMIVGGEKKESIIKYWNEFSSRRHDTTLGLAGVLFNTKVHENFAYDLVYYICKVTKDEELDDRLRCVRDTYKNGMAGVSIMGYKILLPALDGNTEIIKKLYEGLEMLDYKITRASVTFKGSDKDKKYFGSVDEAEANVSDGLGRLGGSKADVAIELCIPYVKNLFVDKFRVPYATVEIDNQLDTIPVKRHQFKLWVRSIFYDEQGEALNQTALEAVVGIFEAKAMRSKKIKTLNLRISDGLTDTSGTAESTDSQQLVSNQPMHIYYDLTNSKNQVIEITSEGWSIKESNQVPEMFYRLQAQQPQITPSRDYPENILDQFMDLINTVVKDVNANELPEETRRTRLLLKCYIIALLIPNIDRVILLLYGEENTGKTAFMELVKMLIDPSGAKTLTFPRSMAEINQQLSHNFIAYYDNVSIIQDWLSDILCRAATGMGFSKRQLYTDDDDIIYEYIRSVGISAIHLPGSKPDMLSRALITKFYHIGDELERKKKGDILPTFDRIRAQVLGYILDILVKAIKVKSQGELQLDTRDRMADWEEWCEIIARCMGYKPLEFINAYKENTKLRADLVLEDRPVARAIVKLVEKLEEGKEWTGIATTLLGVLDTIAATQLDMNTKVVKLWPKSPSKLSLRIAEVRPTLRKMGIEIYDTQDSKTRTKTVHIMKRKEGSKVPLVPFVPPEADRNSKSGSENSRSESKVDRRSNDTNDTNGTLHTSFSTQNDGIYVCAYCEIINQYEGLNNAIKFPTLTAYEKHIVDEHRKRNPNLTFDPEPEDLKKFKRQLQIDRAHENEKLKRKTQKEGEAKGGDTK